MILDAATSSPRSQRKTPENMTASMCYHTRLSCRASQSRHLDFERVLGKFLEDDHGAQVDLDDSFLEQVLHHVDHVSRVALRGYLHDHRRRCGGVVVCVSIDIHQAYYNPCSGT